MTREQRVTLAALRALSTVTEVGGAVVLQMPEAPGSPMLNRIVGLGLGAPATEEQVDAAIAAIDPGVTFYVAVAPEAQPAAELLRWLADRGLQPSWGWMAFVAAPAAVPAARTSLQLAEVHEDGDAAAFARIVREGFGLPRALEPRLARAREQGWECWVAYDGDEPAGAAGLYAAEGAAYLGFAATREAHRGKGAQSALLAARARRAASLGCDVLLVETGERRDDRPSNSYRNILRAGFRETALTANWIGQR